MEGLLSDYLSKNKELMKQETIIQLFHRAVEWYPDKIAVQDEEKNITFQQLEWASNKVAKYLSEVEGIKPDDVVGCSAKRRLSFVILILGIWKTGAAFVAIDKECPEEHIQYCLDAGKVNLNIGSSFLRKVEEYYSYEQVIYEDKSEANTLALILFTSGSTGKAKGVRLLHSNIAASVSNFDVIPFYSTDKLASFSNFLFIAAVFDITVSLAIGITLYIVPDDIRKNISEVARYYCEHKITVSFLPPHMAMKYMAVDEGSPLRMLLVGSEPPRNLEKRKYDIVNVYAASEACAIISRYNITDHRSHYPIGTIVPALRGYVVDDQGKETEIGEEGELWLSGQQIFDSYLNLPELNKKRFQENPFTQEKGFERVFKTADIVKKLPDGTLEYVCRKDNMCKIRGFRVEIAGVEEVMLQIPEIIAACVTWFTDKGGTNILFGYYVSNQVLDHKYIRDELGKKLPYYAIPTGLVQVDAFPKKESGKTDRKGFPPPKELNDHKLLSKVYW